MAHESTMHQQENFVCVNCFLDPGLVTFIEDNSVESACSYCKSIKGMPCAAPVDDVSAYFIECLFKEYALAVNELGWDGREGGWLGTFWDAEELACDVIGLEFPQGNGDELLPDLFGDYFDQDWCERDPYGLNYQQWAHYSWELFCRVVMHERRFFFLDVDHDPRDSQAYSPRQVLQTIFEYVELIGLFEQLAAGSKFFRARKVDCGPILGTAEDMGPPPFEMATQSNRMSPAGIPMFYGCDDEATALKETATEAGDFMIGRFEALRRATLLDLTCIPPVPSLFDSASENVEAPRRMVLIFLHHIAGELSRPIERNERAHVEYVPTQVVTEYIRDQLVWENRRVDGIKYSSSSNPGHASYVLFADQSNVLSTPASRWSEDRWLKLTQTNRSWVDV